MFWKSNYRTNSLNWGFFLAGLQYSWNHLKFWLPTIIISLLIIYFSLVIRLVPFNKIIVEWFLVAMFAYWLISGFVFFLKKYRFGKFTSAIQRFWRRTYILFWIIESCLFVVFIYLLFNASQEQVFGYDFIQLNKTHLFSWKHFILKVFPVTLMIICTYILLLSLKWNVFSKYSFLLFYITFLLTYVIWVEFYQFFYVINWYGEICWFFDIEDKTWYADSIFKRTRILNHYVTICIIAKFWHLIFMYIFWVFFLLRALETKTVHYSLLAANFQNFIILYIMNWLLMYPWVKFYFRRFLSKSHKSLYQTRGVYGSWLYTDFFLYIEGFFNFNFFFKKFTKYNFIYWIESFDICGDSIFWKHFIKTFILREFQKYNDFSFKLVNIY